jgi:hypothetical protein
VGIPQRQKMRTEYSGRVVRPSIILSEPDLCRGIPNSLGIAEQRSVVQRHSHGRPSGSRRMFLESRCLHPWAQSAPDS